jgi:cell wall-associated NlpC family hydrolase
MTAPDWWSAVAAPVKAAVGAAGSAGNSVEATIRQIAGQYNFSDPDLLVATGRQETGLNPLAVGDSGHSYGVFQENDRGRGAGIPVENRQDVTAATIRAIQEFNAIRQRNPNVDRGTWAALAQRPADAAGYARSVNALLGSSPGAAPAPSAAPAAPSGPAWWSALTQTSGTPTTTAAPAAARQVANNQPAWWGAVEASTRGEPAAAPAPTTQASQPSAGGSGLSGPALVKQAQAASWALSQMGSRDFYNLCQRFIENAYGTSGQYRSAAAASNALMKTADPGAADVGDLVFFRPDASNGNAGHVGIYLGNGEMVSATNSGVTRDNIFNSPYWSKLLVGFGDPPDQWQGKASTPELVKGAASLVNTAKTAAPSGRATSSGQPAWWSAVAA